MRSECSLQRLRIQRLFILNWVGNLRSLAYSHVLLMVISSVGLWSKVDTVDTTMLALVTAASSAGEQTQSAIPASVIA